MRIRIFFAASCSLVISAACHPLSDEVNPHLRSVQWGVTKGSIFEGELHRLLSSKPVTKTKVEEKSIFESLARRKLMRLRSYD
jgi:hypothetical protein